MHGLRLGVEQDRGQSVRERNLGLEHESAGLGGQGERWQGERERQERECHQSHRGRR